MSKNLDELIQTGQRQYRNLMLEAKDVEGEQEEEVVEGYATTYNEPYHLMRFQGKDDYTIEVKEEVDRHAFDDTDMSDVIMQYDHQGRVFARLSNDTLELDKDNEKGLYIRANLGGTDIGKQLYQEIKGGYTNKMSFGFTIEKASELRQIESDEADEVYVYTIEKVGKLYDVSAVSLPQNDFTSISARNFNDGEIVKVATERLQRHEQEVERQERIKRLEALLGEE